MKDNLIICPKCGGNACYETDHTFSTGLNIKSWMCLGCGFTSNSTLIKGSEELEATESSLPELYKDLKFVDNVMRVWYPSVLNIPELGIVFLNGTSSEEWGWAGVKAIPVEENEKTLFPIPGSPGKFYQYKSDMSTLTMFGKQGFMDACEFINFFGNKSLVS